MKIWHCALASMALAAVAAGCSGEGDKKDRTDARRMFSEISALTKNYTAKFRNVRDSASWADVCSEYEEKLEKINFSFPADTDLLLSEGQNDTINVLMQAYIKARDGRIRAIMHPVLPSDSVPADSTAVARSSDSAVKAGASHSHDN